MQLPVEEVLPQLMRALQDSDNVVLEAPPGAGKTTRVPLAVIEQPAFTDKKVLVLEPRRIAARAAAERMAALLDEPVGRRVGFRVRGESRISAHTRIEVITEGILIRMLLDDPALNNIALVAFDEFHERNLDSDLALALALYGREVFREPDNPLKLLVMSATLDGQAVAELLGNAPVIASQGRSFPVEIKYVNDDSKLAVEQLTARTVSSVVNDHDGDVLVFLPGKKEISRTTDLLAECLPDNIDVRPLYGELSLPQQRAAVAASPGDRRKVVLATSIAESSLTIEGIKVVVDSGYARLPAFDPRTAMTRLTTRRASKAAADQRAGRAGRLSAGVCYRLWAESQHDSRAAFTTAEIQQADLAALLLSLYRFGVDSAAELQWLDPPPGGAMQQAQSLLLQLGALSRDQSAPSQTPVLTTHGEHMADLPVHPRLSHMLISAQRVNLLDTACQLAATLSARDTLRGQGADIALRLQTFDNNTQHKHSEQWQIYRQLHRQFAGNQITAEAPAPVDAVGYLLASAYPDRIAKRRSNAQYLLANGRAAQLNEDDPLCRCEWLAVAHLGGNNSAATDNIYLASALDNRLFDHELAPLVTRHDDISWPANSKALVCETQWKVGHVQVRKQDLRHPPDDLRAEAVTGYLRKQGLQILPWTDHTNALLARLRFVKNHLIDESQQPHWPDVEPQSLLDTMDTWLAPWLQSVSHVNHIAALNMQSIVDAMLPWDQRQQLDTLAPTHFKVPSGSRIRIDYSDDEPVLAVRLQELLGAQQHPSIGNGYPLKVSLLSPAHRQIQLTRDIPGFWSGSYAQVQKDMKSRYPKHFWPDDPASATASNRSVKPRKS
ncbi:MAG: ATP-dependent helicase HrpB [Pseudomonadota bacterium]